MDLFDLFDRDQDGVIGISDAYTLLLFEIPIERLALAWDLADRSQCGHLSREAYSVFSRLVAAVQGGGSIDPLTPDSPWFRNFHVYAKPPADAATIRYMTVYISRRLVIDICNICSILVRMLGGLVCIYVVDWRVYMF